MFSQHPRLWIDETSFQLGASVAADKLEQSLQGLVDLIQACRDKKETIVRSSHLYETEIWPGLQLFELLYDASKLATQIDPVDPIALKAIQQALNRSVEWDNPLPANSTVEVAGVTVDAPMIVAVCSLDAAGRGAACLALGVRRDRIGEVPVRLGNTDHAIHFLAKRKDLPAFYRSIPEKEDLGPEAFMENAEHAFPELAFAPGLAEQFSRFSLPYREVRPLVTLHLSVLNDDFARLLRSEPDVRAVQAQLSARGVDASPESAKTRRNAKAIKERDVSLTHVFVAGKELPVAAVVRCEWHTKLRYDTDRIHFHPGSTDIDGRVFVGIFHAHLST